jgi:hypothetical protein
MGSVQEFFQVMRRNAAQGMATQSFAALGEVSEYDPTEHSARFVLPMYLDNDGQPIETAKIPLGSPFTGVGTGIQFPIKNGAQALLIFADERRMLPVAATFLYNGVETPPFVDGKSSGWIDDHGNTVKSTQDGATAGDGAGGVKINAKGYVEHTTSGGHSTTMDDVSNKITTQVSGGGVKTVLDKIAQTLQHICGSVKTIVDGANNQISHIAPSIGLGDIPANLASNRAAIVSDDIHTVLTELDSHRRDDLLKLVTAMITSGVPNAGTVAANLASLLPSTVPSGSTVVKIK